MCRPQSAGGRRCPLHSSSGFVGTRLARRSSGLDSRQVNAAFQVLRHEGARATDPTPAQWAEYLQTKAEEIESSGYGSRTIRAMRKHIEEAAGESPDGPTFYALSRLDARSQAQRAALNEVVDGLSSNLGISRTAARQRFAQLRSEVDMSRGADLPSGYSSRAFRTARDLGMPLDTPTMHALGSLSSAQAEESAQEQRRVQLAEYPDSAAIHSMGYDNGRLELRFREGVDNEDVSRIYAYHNVPETVWSRFQTNAPGYVYNNFIRGRSQYLYSSPAAEQADAMQRRCAECGQFASSSHSCPPRQTPLPADSASVDNWTEAQTPEYDWEDGPLLNSLHAPEPEASASEEADEPSVPVDRVEAVRSALAQIEERQQTPTPELPSPEEATEYSVEEYMEDLQALQANGSGVDAVPYMTENATNGLLTPESGVGFGVELEFDDGGDEDVRERIGRRLHEAGITSSPHQQRYHAAADAANPWSGWSYEEDETVGGEIVSPILYDRPEDWETLRKVCDIVREEGGVASMATGGHVHISSGALGNSIAKHSELLNTVSENEDLLYRLGTNPNAERHRTLYWCAPNPDVDDSYERMHAMYRASTDENESRFYHFRSRHGSHSLGLNMGASGDGAKSHIEFRQFDGTLNPAVIQTQVKMSAAIMAKVARTEVNENEIPTARTRRGIGANANALANQTFNSETEQHAAQSQDMRNLASQVFTRREDRAQMAALFAATTWQNNLPDWDESSSGDYEEDDYYGDDYDDDY